MHTPSSRSALVLRFAFALLVLLTWSTHARADDDAAAREERRRAQAREAMAREEHKLTHWGVRGFFDGGAGLRTVAFKGLTLTTPSSRSAEQPPALVYEGSRLSPGVVFDMTLGGGVAVGPLFFGLQLEAGFGGGVRGQPQHVADIDVQPSGTVALMNDAVFVGYMMKTRYARLRLDAVLGTELVGIGVDRPSFPDTRVSAVNDIRWTLGPRFRADFYHDEFASLGVAFGFDARNPMNASLHLVMSF